MDSTDSSLTHQKELTADVLKVAEHTLKKRLEAKRTDIIDRLGQIAVSAGPDLAEIGEIIHKVASDGCSRLQARTKKALSPLNKMEMLCSEDTISVMVSYKPEGINFSSPADWPKEPRDAGTYFLSNLKRCLTMVVESVESGNITISADIEFGNGVGDDWEEYFSISRKFSEPAPDTLIRAVEKCRTSIDDFLLFSQQLGETCKQIEGISATMRELEMQAVVDRVKRYGGEDLLVSVLGSASTAISGSPIDGISVSLPDYSGAASSGAAERTKG